MVLPKLVFILGITNIISLLLVLLSCRCVALFDFFRKSRFYPAFYKYHCLFWYIFVISVALHTILAIYAHGIPF